VVISFFDHINNSNLLQAWTTTNLRGLTGKNDTIHTNIQINGPKLV